MKNIGDEIHHLFNKAKRPASKRAYVIQVICEELFKQKDFKKILGQTKECTIAEIEEIYQTAKSWDKNPQALFWKLVKEKKEEIEKLKKRKNNTK